ncbi:MAG: glycoside hydrolase family 15 protein [Gemmatimonadales bacterium]
MDHSTQAFGKPGIAPTWSSSDKDLVTTALGPSRIWATLGYGIINEVYWPATGDPQIRDLGFIVARDGDWIELKRARRYRITLAKPHVPLPRVVHEGPGYRLTLEVVPDPSRDVLLVSYALDGDYDLYFLLAPHLASSGLGNTAWVDGDLFAQRGNHALALVGSAPFLRASAGYVGASDGWQDFNRNGRMTYTFDRAEEGNVALMGQTGARSGVLALGFGRTPEGARTLAVSSLTEGFEASRALFVAGWEQWADRLQLPAAAPAFGAAVAEEAYLSAVMLKVHEDRAFPGAIVASLSVPWGSSSDSSGGYHLVWARDAVESGFGLLAVEQRDDAERVLAYLVATQLPDGHWHQNFFPDGRPFWDGVQLDEAGFPILLAAKLLEKGALRISGTEVMAKRAAAYIASWGPGTPQDRWEENGGNSPFTLAVEVAALVAAASMLSGRDGEYALSLADYWNERIEEWCYVTDTLLARDLGVAGYYVRLGPIYARGVADRITLRNHDGAESATTEELVGLEFLALARFGLRRADDPRILDSLRVADVLLRVDTPSGPLYHRYNGDGYGEHADGGPFDGVGIGRAWPLLTGERGHLALALGEDPMPYLGTMLRTAGTCGLLPEQAWDAAPIPERGLHPGRPSGSAMPLLWAHAEFLQLLAGCDLGRPFQLLRTVKDRYGGRRPDASTWHWRAETDFAALPPGRALLIEDRVPFTLHYAFDDWSAARDRAAEEQGLGMFGVRLSAEDLASRDEIRFTRRFGDEWEGLDHRIALGVPAPPGPGA